MTKIVIVLLISLATMALVLFVVDPVQAQAQQNQTNQNQTVKTIGGLNATSLTNTYEILKNRSKVQDCIMLLLSHYINFIKKVAYSDAHWN